MLEKDDVERIATEITLNLGSLGDCDIDFEDACHVIQIIGESLPHGEARLCLLQIHQQMVFNTSNGLRGKLFKVHRSHFSSLFEEMMRADAARRKQR